MAKTPKLSRKRREYVDQRASGILVGAPITYPAGQIEKYDRALGRLTQAMYREYARELAKVFRDNEVITIADSAMDASISSQAQITLNKLRNKFARVFAKNASTIVDRVFNGVEKSAGATLNQSLKDLSGGVTLKTSAMPAALKQSIKAAVANNVTLIKSISDQYHTQIEGAVMRSLQPGGRGMADVREALTKYEGITDRRRDLIAKTEVRKATMAIGVERSKSAGVKKFKWRHSAGGSEPRELHIKLNGQIFSYDDPPVIDDRTGEKGFPGQLINCRCVAIPVIEWGDDDEE